MKIYWKYFALFLSYLPKIIADDLSCITQDVYRIRNFQTLVQYQANKLSFNPHDSTYDGNYVSFSFYSVSHLEENAFNTFTSSNIIALDLSGKSIKKIDERAFLTLSCLHQLDLSNNVIYNLTKDMFKELVNLRTLNISRNYLNYLYDNVFSNLKRVQIMDISYNNITELGQKAFYDIPTLEKLIMSHNHMKRIKYVYFNQLILLKELYLDHNDIAMIPTWYFSENVHLEKLDFSGNQMIMIDTRNDYRKLPSIQHLNLSDNYLTSLHVENISYYLSNPNLTIDFNHNAFDCKDWVQYLNEFKEKGINISPGRSFTQKYNINGIACHTVNFYHTDLYSDEDTDDVQAKLEDDKQYEVGLNNTLDNIVHEVNQSKIELSDKRVSTSDIKKPGTENSGNGIVTGVTIALAIMGVIFLALVTVLSIGFMRKMRRV